MTVTERQQIFYLNPKIINRIFYCYLIVNNGNKYYEAVGDRRIGIIAKVDQTHEQLSNWFVDLVLAEVKKVILPKMKS